MLFIRILVDYVIPYYSNNTREFMLYRVASKKVIALAKQVDTRKFVIDESYALECIYKGKQHTHTINFNSKSCTCCWFLAFAVCSHIIAACDHYNRELQGYKVAKAFVYKAKRGRKPRAMTFTEQAFRENPMPLIPLIVNEDSRESLFIPGNILSLPSISQPVPVVRVTRAYTRKVTTVDVPDVPIVSNAPKGKRLVKSKGAKEFVPDRHERPEKRGRGRPRKVAGALENC